MTGSSRRPIQATIRSTGPEAEDAGDLFREALSHWASGVAILAVSDGEEIDAITVSAFSALSMDPPLVLASVGEQASVLPMLREERRYTVSILAEGQQRIAGAVAQRLPGSDSIYHGLDDPAVTDALVAMRCTLWEDYPGGDHRIVVGKVESVALGAESGPLLYYRRGYRKLR